MPTLYQDKFCDGSKKFTLLNFPEGTLFNRVNGNDNILNQGGFCRTHLRGRLNQTELTRCKKPKISQAEFGKEPRVGPCIRK